MQVIEFFNVGVTPLFEKCSWSVCVRRATPRCLRAQLKRRNLFRGRHVRFEKGKIFFRRGNDLVGQYRIEKARTARQAKSEFEGME